MGLILDHLPATGAGHAIAATPDEVRTFLAGDLRGDVAAGSLPGTVRELPAAAAELETALSSLAVLRDMQPPESTLILPTTAKRWTVVFMNASACSAWPAFGKLITEALQTRAVYFLRRDKTIRRSKDGKVKGAWGAFRFAVVDCGRETRRVSLYNDGGNWYFATDGPPFPFEETEAYSRRKKADRLNSDRIVRYLAAMGLRPFDDDFYDVTASRPAQLVELIVTDPEILKRCPTVTLEEKRRQWE